MDIGARRKLLASPWLPKLYLVDELAQMLRIPVQEAADLILSVNAGDVQKNFVTHHDLVTFLRDMVLITEVPEHEEEVSAHGRWLLVLGWGIDTRRSVYRWIDSESPNPNLRFSLRGALQIQLIRLNTAVQEEDAPIDVEFEMR